VYDGDQELKQALDMLGGGYFSCDAPDRFRPVFDALTTFGDRYLLLADYRSYVQCQEGADALYQNEDEWVRAAILNVAGMGRFSSDRTVLEYANAVWNAKRMPTP
jgi:starch phosphorylase